MASSSESWGIGPNKEGPSGWTGMTADGRPARRAPRELGGLLGARAAGGRLLPFADAPRLLGGRAEFPGLRLLGARLEAALRLLGGCAVPFDLVLLGGRCVAASLLAGRRLVPLLAWATLPFLLLAGFSAPPLAWREAARASAVGLRLLAGRAALAGLRLLAGRSLAPFAARRLEGRWLLSGTSRSAIARRLAERRLLGGTPAPAAA
jgi:hypothetical protein